jgi:hypothetical protein
MVPQVVTVPRPAFACCRWTLTGLLWLALLGRQPWLLGLAVAILAVSAVVRVDRSPLVLLYRWTLGRLFPPTRFACLDVAAMRFAHGMGACLGAGVLLAVLRSPRAGWPALGAFCLLKSVSALGFCPASKLFTCLRKGGCCAWTRGAC